MSVRGEVLAYDDGPGTGWVSGDDGVRYSFVRSDLQQLTPIRAGTKVDFVPADGVASQIFVVAHAQARPTVPNPGVSGSGSSVAWRRLFLDANGRIGQKDYWLSIVGLFFTNLLLSWVPLIGLIVALAAAYGGICVSSKRLHDMGRSGWLAAIPYGVLVAATLLSAVSFAAMMGAAGYDNDLGVAAGLGSVGLLWMIAAIINLGFIIWLGVTAGQPDDNQYGPPPQPLIAF